MSDEKSSVSPTSNAPDELSNLDELSPPATADVEESPFDLSQDIADILASFAQPKSTVASNQPRNVRESNEYDDSDGDVFQKRRILLNDQINKRAYFRHPVRWRVAIVNKSSGKHEIFHGRTHDVSMFGISILLERNVIFTSEVVVLLAIPPMHQGLKETIVEIQCNLTHSVLDSEHNLFRLGMKFVHFKRDGQRILSDTLSKRHIPKPEPNPYSTRPRKI